MMMRGGRCGENGHYLLLGVESSIIIAQAQILC
jgi:hypothetical protein